MSNFAAATRCIIIFTIIKMGNLKLPTYLHLLFFFLNNNFQFYYENQAAYVWISLGTAEESFLHLWTDEFTD